MPPRTLSEQNYSAATRIQAEPYPSVRHVGGVAGQHMSGSNAPVNGRKTSVLPRLTILFAAVVGLTLLASCTGFLIYCCRQRKTRKERLAELQNRAKQANADRRVNQTTQPGSVDGAHQDDTSASFGNSFMSHNAFEGRELELYRKERKLKRRAEIVVRSSQHIDLPIQVHYLKNTIMLSKITKAPGIVVGGSSSLNTAKSGFHTGQHHSNSKPRIALDKSETQLNPPPTTKSEHV